MFKISKKEFEIIGQMYDLKIKQCESKSRIEKLELEAKMDALENKLKTV